MARRGSPPHARGALQGRRRAHTGRGITPACAGSTSRCCCQTGWSRDHPRMRGEHLSKCRDGVSAEGSPPHARGAHCVAARPGVQLGITPACAGSTKTSFWDDEKVGDHPRMRGEHQSPPLTWSQSMGSPPHARGALTQSAAARTDSGITPACAGSTVRPCRRPERGWDHPRMRGEHFVPRQGRDQAVGSPPHARGAQKAIQEMRHV